MAPSTVGARKWEFKARFRRGAFGWRSQPAVTRVRQAVAEIKKVARRDPVLAAEGAVAFLERISPALEQVDSSSGSIGTAVNNAIEELASLIREARADPNTRQAWLERLWTAYQADQIPYLETLGEYWGELCATPVVASHWADDLIGATRLALSRDPGVRGLFHGTTACLSALFAAGRFAETLDLLQDEDFWPYRRWAVKALAAMGCYAEALGLAESSRGPYTHDLEVDRVCEEILFAQGRIGEAYQRYGLTANRRGTYLAWFRAVAQRYPDKAPSQILEDLIATTPGEEGKWFSAAKQLGLYEEALALASTSPCDPKTLIRAARAFEADRPEFALGAGLTALHWLVKGYGYETTGADVWMAYSKTMAAAKKCGRSAEVMQRVRELVANEDQGGFVTRMLARELGL